MVVNYGPDFAGVGYGLAGMGAAALADWYNKRYSTPKSKKTILDQPTMSFGKRSRSRTEQSRRTDSSRVVRNKSGIKQIGDNTTTNVINNVGIQSVIERPLSMKLDRKYKHVHCLAPFNPTGGQNASIKLQFRWEAVSSLNRRNPVPIFIRHNQSAVSLDDPFCLSPVQLTRTVNVQDSSTTAKGLEINTCSRIGSYDETTGQPNYLVAPVNIYNLENISWNLNPFKFYNSPNLPASLSSSAQVVGGKVPFYVLADCPLYDDSDPLSYSPSYSYFPNNAERQRLRSGGELVAEAPPFMCNLLGGYFRQVFQNNLATPCIVEVVAYTYRDISAVDDNGTNMYNDVVETIGDAWVNHQETVLANNFNASGHTWDKKDVLLDPKYPFLPSTLSKEYEAPAKFRETSRIKFELGGGNRRQLNIQLPAVQYDPVYTNNIRSSATYEYKHQLQVMLMVSVNGIKMPAFPQYATAGTTPVAPDEWFAQTTNLANNLVDLGYCPSSVSVFGEYVENIGPCYATRNDPAINIRGFLNPASVAPETVPSTAPDVIPTTAIVSGYILDPAQTVRTTLSDVVPVEPCNLIA